MYFKGKRDDYFLDHHTRKRSLTHLLESYLGYSQKEGSWPDTHLFESHVKPNEIILVRDCTWVEPGGTAISATICLPIVDIVMTLFLNIAQRHSSRAHRRPQRSSAARGSTTPAFLTVEEQQQLGHTHTHTSPPSPSAASVCGYIRRDFEGFTLNGTEIGKLV